MNCNYGNFDIYSNGIGFFFNDKEKIGTFLGLFLTIIYILSSITFFIIYLLNTIERKNLKVNEFILYSKDLPNIEISPNLIYFAFSLEYQNSSSRYIDETIYYPEILFISKNKINGTFNITDKKELEYEVCKKEKFEKDYQNILTNEDLNNSYCLKDFNASLIGGYKYDRMSYLTIKLYPCINTTENNNHCKPQEIDRYLKDGYFSILIKDIGLNPNNYSFPLISTYQNLYTNIGKSKYKDLFIIYGITEIQTDTSLFQEKIKTEKYLQFRKYEQSFYLREDSMYYENENKPIISVEFRLDDNIFIQKRTYTKITDVLYIIGGYMQILNTIFSLISILSNRLIPKLKILNGIFNFNFKEKKITMKINSIKEFKSILLKKTFVLPSNKQLFNLTYKTPINNNIFRNSLKINNNRNSNNNMSKNSLIGLDNNGNNSSVMNNILNQRKHNSLIVIKESINSNNNSSVVKESLINERKNNFMSKNDNNKSNGNKNYIYRVGSFYPKFMTSEKKQNSDDNDTPKEYTDKLKFNIFDYYCFRIFSRKKKDIELYKLGLSAYTKRMDIINVFTLLMLSEKNCLQSEDLY